MVRPRDVKLPYLHAYKDRHGRTRSNYRRVEITGGKRIAVPLKGEFGSEEWLDNYNKIHAEFEGRGQKKPPSPDTFADLIPRWLATLTDRSENTRINYVSISNKLLDWIGDQKVTNYRVRDVYDLQDTIAEMKTPAIAKRCITVLSLIFKYAKRRGLIEINPAYKIERPTGLKKTPHRSWTDEEINLVLNNAPDHIVRNVMVLLHTGLRAGDAIKLQWSHISDDGFITLKTQKTGAEVCIPISDELAKELARPKRGLYLLMSKTGRPYSKRTIFSTDIRTHLRKLGIDDVPPVHGLRKNAVQRLVEDGNDYNIIAAITGQSDDMIAHYGQAYKRKKLASQAVIKPRFGGG